MSNVKTYSKKSNGSTYLTTNFKVKEFACNDGSDKILIDNEMVYILQKIRNLSGKAVTINSAYRTSSYNSKVGGSSTSYHLYGRAFDIKTSGLSLDDICKIANTLGVKGIIRYSTFVHIDSRASAYYYNNVSKKKVTFGTYTIPFTANVKSGTKGVDTACVQFKLNSLGYSCGTADGICGTKTVTAIKNFQKAKGLSADGVCGTKTWAKLFG